MAVILPSAVLRSLTVEGFLAKAGEVPVIDVRSPGEFARGHIPGAHSLPLFSDTERTVIGTLYKQQGRNVAVLEGLRMVGPRMAAMVEEGLKLAPGGRIAVHCWRGGERSGSVAWLLDKAGFEEVSVLQGGYKQFRAHVLASFGVARQLRVVGGYTGTGKTELLHLLNAVGEPTLDLESLANHRGSSFGALDGVAQPTTEQFENLIWHALREIAPERPIWVEDESMMIGRVKIPDALYDQMRTARLYFVDMPKADRAARLVVDYGARDKTTLAEAILRIQKRMGPQHCRQALEALDAGDLRSVALITLGYYDKAYLRGTSSRSPERITTIPVRASELRTLATQLKDDVTT